MWTNYRSVIHELPAYLGGIPEFVGVLCVNIFSFCLYWTKYIVVHKPTKVFCEMGRGILFFFFDLKITKRTSIMTHYDASYMRKTLVKIMTI
jgi:hypothetical protein